MNLAKHSAVRARLLEFLLWSQLVTMTTLLLSAIGCAWRQPSVAFAADDLLAIVF